MLRSLSLTKLGIAFSFPPQTKNQPQNPEQSNRNPKKPAGMFVGLLQLPPNRNHLNGLIINLDYLPLLIMIDGLNGHIRYCTLLQYVSKSYFMVDWFL